VGIETAQLTKLLQGIGVRPEQGFLSQVLSLATPAEPVFSGGELALFAPILAQGLAEAGPSERVSFILASAQPGRRNTPLSGYLSVRDPYLKFVLNDHPTIGWQDPEDPSSPKLFDLEFLREGFLLPGSEGERKGSYKARPVIQVDYKGYLRALAGRPGMSTVVPEPLVATPAPSPVQPPVSPAHSAETARPPSRPLPPPLPDPATANSPSVKDLQRQVKELTESNQELRATFKDMLERQEKTQRELKDLNRLRQELAETKQLLADKVLELNKLKSQPGKPNKEKTPSLPAR
jgi:hypothetical protein